MLHQISCFVSQH